MPDITVDFPTDALETYSDQELEAYALNLQESADRLKSLRREVAAEKDRRADVIRVDQALAGLSDAQVLAMVERVTGQKVEPSMLAEERAKLTSQDVPLPVNENTQVLDGAGGVVTDLKPMEKLEG